MTAQFTTLPNGLRVVTDRIDSVESAALGCWIGVGTRYESADVNGVSHLLEHMAFKGTGRRGPVDIASEIEAVGGHLNAYTSYETTAYFARVLAEDLGLGLDIVADILQHSTFPADELDRERGVILQEIGQARDMPEDVVFDVFQATTYPDQAVGRTVLGDPEVIRSIQREAVAGYMVDRYRPGRMVVSAAGRVDHDEVVRFVEHLFDALPDGDAVETDPSRYVGGDTRVERAAEQLHLVFGFEGVGANDPSFFTLHVLSRIYGGGMSSRLFQEVRERRGLVYSIHSFVSPLSDGGQFGVYAGTGEAEGDEVLRVAATELRAIADSAGEDEVARARAQLKASVLMARESTSARAEHAAQHLLVHGRLIPASEIVERIDAVDVAAVREMAARLLGSPLTLAAVGPVGALADTETVRGWFSA